MQDPWFLILQWFSAIIETTTKNGVVRVATSNVKLFLKTIWFNHFRIHNKNYFPVKFVVSLIIFVNDCRYIFFYFFLNKKFKVCTDCNTVILRLNAPFL